MIKKLFDEARADKVNELFYILGRMKSELNGTEVLLKLYSKDVKGIDRRLIKNIFSIINLSLKMIVIFPISIIKEEYKKAINKDNQ